MQVATSSAPHCTIPSTDCSRSTSLPGHSHSTIMLHVKWTTAAPRTKLTSSSATSGPSLVEESSAASQFSSCVWVIPILRSIRRFSGEIRVPGCVRRKKVRFICCIPHPFHSVHRVFSECASPSIRAICLPPCSRVARTHTCVSRRIVGTASCTQKVDVWYCRGFPSLRCVPSNLPVFTCTVCLPHR